MTKPKMPAAPALPPPPPPPVSATGKEKTDAELEERRKAGKRYSFADTILAPPAPGLKTTLG